MTEGGVGSLSPITVAFERLRAKLDGITDQAQLTDIVAQWVFLTKVRVVLWSLEWLVMMYYFSDNLYRRIKES